MGFSFSIDIWVQVKNYSLGIFWELSPNTSCCKLAKDRAGAWARVSHLLTYQIFVQNTDNFFSSNATIVLHTTKSFLILRML